MSTYVLNPNDTIVLSDTIVFKITKASEACHHVIIETRTTQEDIWIAAAVCIAVMVIIGLLSWVMHTWFIQKNKVLMEELQIKKIKVESECKIMEGESEDKKEENKLRREKYKQETEQSKFDAEFKRSKTKSEQQ